MALGCDRLCRYQYYFIILITNDTDGHGGWEGSPGVSSLAWLGLYLFVFLLYICNQTVLGCTPLLIRPEVASMLLCNIHRLINTVSYVLLQLTALINTGLIFGNIPKTLQSPQW